MRPIVQLVVLLLAVLTTQVRSASCAVCCQAICAQGNVAAQPALGTHASSASPLHAQTTTMQHGMSCCTHLSCGHVTDATITTPAPPAITTELLSLESTATTWSFSPGTRGLSPPSLSAPILATPGARGRPLPLRV